MFHEAEQKKKLLPPLVAFASFFFIGYGCWGVVNSYWPMYFNSFGYNNTQIGILSAVGPFAAVFGLLFWGARADRARYRNNVQLLICAILGVSSQLYLLNSSFFYTFVLSIVFMFCFYSMTPVCDAMFLEYAQSGAANYGKGRMWGSLGLAVVPLLPGFIISRLGIRSLFPSYLGLILLAIFVVLQLPKMAGGQSGNEKKINLLAVRNDKQLVGLVVFLFLLHTTMGFYYSFFPIYMDNLGAADLVGINNMAQFTMEFLITYFLVRIVKRFGFAKLYTYSIALTAVRLLLIGLITSPTLLIVVNLIGGAGYSMCMMMFSIFALRTPRELRTSAQMLNSMVAHSFSRFCGSMIGGALADVIGIPSVFVCMGLFNVLLTAVFIFWIRRTDSLHDPVLM